ncbi:DUF3617 domain-containing protein [Povalibacter sp.]|uniref:DUF3617 domain-containing protein n=1 Tax=Povalibacter sp. TaxID=1962978 RepID=UPI002F3F9819
MTRSNVLVAAALASLSVSSVVVGAERLNVKTGLWEIESLTQMGGVMPLSRDLKARLTPAQIAKMQADWKASAAEGPDRDVSRECITEKDLAQPFSSADSKNCRQTIVNTSRTTQEVRMVCEGEHRGSGLLKVNAPTPQTMTASLELKFGEGTDMFTMKGSMKGRWLSDDCGDEADNGDMSSDQDDEPSDDVEEEDEE